MRISDSSSDVCSSDLHGPHRAGQPGGAHLVPEVAAEPHRPAARHDPEGPRAGALLRVLRGRRARPDVAEDASAADRGRVPHRPGGVRRGLLRGDDRRRGDRSEEHTSELQSLMRISYAVFCLKNKKKITHTEKTTTNFTIHNTTT